MGLCNEQQFREPSLKGPVIVPAKTNDQLERLSEIEKFEHSFPFHRMRIDKFEGHIKRFVYKDDDACISMRQLQFSFEEEELFSDLQDETTMFYRLMSNEFL